MAPSGKARGCISIKDAHIMPPSTTPPSLPLCSRSLGSDQQCWCSRRDGAHRLADSGGLQRTY